ncbi:uncharacterized protein DS421_12g357420 [Arachis hypogaea]|nr:uncharacterized protein DS421_12g357420 [Arachis hypogaea]
MSGDSKMKTTNSKTLLSIQPLSALHLPNLCTFLSSLILSLIFSFYLSFSIVTIQRRKHGGGHTLSRCHLFLLPFLFFLLLLCFCLLLLCVFCLFSFCFLI